jgi:hypothetical protein
MTLAIISLSPLSSRQLEPRLCGLRFSRARRNQDHSSQVSISAEYALGGRTQRRQRPFFHKGNGGS